MPKSDHDELMDWFQRLENRPAASLEEALGRLLARSHEINPRLRKRDELLKDYATRMGGQTLAYAKLREPVAWGEWNVGRDNGAVVALMNISEEAGLDIMGGILQNVNPALRQTAEYREQPSAEHLHAVDYS